MTERTLTVQDIDWFSDQYSFKRLDLSPPYQRYSVWSKGYQQYFIDTILKNFPSPSIFLHKDNLPDEQHIYHVVDGKQRLTSIFEFKNNEFSLPKDHDQFPDKYYDDLPPDVKTSFGNYKIPIEMIHTKNEAYLKEVFDRLNRNVRKLNPQELRHARHDGPFMQMIDTLIKDPFWEEIGISIPARIRSMRDAEFVSEIFLLTMHGAFDSQRQILDRYYAEYDDEESFEKAHAYRGMYEGCLSIMKNLGADFLKDTRYSNLNDFYSLWDAVKEYSENPRKINYEKTRENLRQFSEIVTNPDNIPADNKDALDYSDAVRQGANKKNNRQTRAATLKKMIVM